MTNMIKMMALGGGFAALAAAAPATAQYYPYSYGNYGYNNVTALAAQRCQAAVQNRLSYRTNTGLLGALLGTSTSGRVIGVTQVTPRRNMVRVRGVASTGRLAYNPYGVGYYGTLGANYALQPDLSFRCDVDYRGYVRDVDINRR
ncbi:MAG TPA: hypothetical protein VFR36_01075 [Sphingomicrobium sp.]|nr:hypothetical protein [Sphingomicrobium sp.]